jgi:hypothetical protein
VTERKPLSPTEEAFLVMILEEHRAALVAADARRDARMKPLFAEKGIPEGVPVNIDKTQPDLPAVLTYEVPPAAKPLKAPRVRK